jgi:hypothetical protein
VEIRVALCSVGPEGLLGQQAELLLGLLRLSLSAAAEAEALRSW